MRAHFQIVLHSRDLPLLKNIQAFFSNVGNISLSNHRESVSFIVSSFKEINRIIIPHFNRYSLLTNKQGDFLLFKSALEIINQGEHINPEGLRKIAAIKASVNTGKIPEEFLGIKPVIRPEVLVQKIVDPYWLIGFIEGEGCFYVGIFKNSTHSMGYQTKLKFQITQHSRDNLLIKSLVDSLDCGTSKSKGNACYFAVNNFSDLEQKIIPFILNRPLQGTKFKDFEDFCKIVKLMKNKEHLTLEGFDKIKKNKI